jgi:molybdopterin synthase catalytic subunit
LRTIVVLLFASEHRHKMSTGTSTVHKYVKEHYPISREHHGAREHQVEDHSFELYVGVKRRN